MICSYDIADRFQRGATSFNGGNSACQNFARGSLNLRFLGGLGPSWPKGKCVTDFTGRGPCVLNLIIKRMIFPPLYRALQKKHNLTITQNLRKLTKFECCKWLSSESLKVQSFFHLMLCSLDKLLELFIIKFIFSYV